MPVPANLVHQLTTGTGTGNLPLTAVPGKQTFGAAFPAGTANECDYFVSHRTAAEWEYGTAHVTAGALVRDTVIGSSNANAAVNFSAGDKDVTNDIPAAKQVTTDTVQTLSNKTFDAPALGTPVSANLANCTGLPTTGLVDEAVTYAKMQNISATARLLGRKTAAAGDPEECTLSEVLDFVGSAARGDLLVRGAATWARKAKGTAGQVLVMDADDPVWADQIAGDINLGLLINPFFEISQENGTSAGAAASAYYAADQWFSLENSDAVLSVQNVADPFSSTATLKRLKNSIKATATTADASFASGQYIQSVVQKVEGTFWRSLGWGGGDARAIDVVIIAQCSVSGTYPVAIRNAAANRSYVTTISLTANTPTVCLVTIPGDTSGTWETGAVASSDINLGVVAGSTFQAASLNTWVSTNSVSHSSCTNWASSGTTNFFQVGYCQVFPAGVLPFTSAAQITGEALQILLNMRRPYDDELRRCQRYARRWGSDAKGIWTGSGASPRLAEQNTVTMRTSPAATLLSTTPIIENWNITGYAGSGSTVSANGSNEGSVDLTISGFSSGVANGTPAFSPNDIAFLSARM